MFYKLLKKEREIGKEFSRKKQISEDFKQELANLTNYHGLNLGDYELLYFNKNSTIEQKQKLVDLLREVHLSSEQLPTVGVELSYTARLKEDFLQYLIDGRFILPNQVPKSYNAKINEKFHEPSYSKGEGSEIRLLPTNPYTFRWLLKQIHHGLPQEKAQVQICVGDVNDKRMPYIFLALYFMNVACAFPTKSSEGNDHIGFPGCYVGQSVRIDKDPTLLISRAQTNYSVLKSDDLDEMADACFYTAKLHSISDEEFANFEEDLRKVLGFQNRRQVINGEVWLRERDELNDLLEKEWPRRNADLNAPYQPPPEFLTYSIEKVKEEWELKKLEYDINNVDVEDINAIHALSEHEDLDNLRDLTIHVKEVLEQHLNITPSDIMYRTSLNELMNR
ncbi:hypothetical protein COV11_04875 [Candidatus Woesearchaeota archaeon CG10_big_fil_rev_8_21_14_0_10_30_7]|nr:MAG: hypothetical protein COV11_04875 [Candidatus Woesearchaeota archaeon CG10_big_fil_rev_8_21_14_0_10_30_7]